MSAVVEIFEDGAFKKYKRFSTRLPLFHEMFPIKEGWRHLHEAQDASAMVPQLTALHLAALSAGKNPTEVGLPPLPRGMVFTARLINPQGEEVASGSAISMSMDLFSPRFGSDFGGRDSFLPRKDFESGETAAFQRLLAAVGIGGEMFDADEDQTIAAMGLKTKTGQQESALTAVASVSPIRSSIPDEQRPFESAVAGELPDPIAPLDAFASISAEEVPETGVFRRTEAVEQPVKVVVEPVVENVSSPSVVEASTKEPVIAGQSAQSSNQPSIGPGGARGPSDIQRLAALVRQIVVLGRQAKTHANAVSTIEEANEELDRLTTLLSS